MQPRLLAFKKALDLCVFHHIAFDQHLNIFHQFFDPPPQFIVLLMELLNQRPVFLAKVDLNYSFDIVVNGLLDGNLHLVRDINFVRNLHPSFLNFSFWLIQLSWHRDLIFCKPRHIHRHLSPYKVRDFLRNFIRDIVGYFDLFFHRLLYFDILGLVYVNDLLDLDGPINVDHAIDWHVNHFLVGSAPLDGHFNDLNLFLLNYDVLLNDFFNVDIFRYLDYIIDVSDGPLYLFDYLFLDYFVVGALDDFLHWDLDLFYDYPFLFLAPFVLLRLV